MNKSTLNLIAKSVKNLDESLWSLRRESDEYNTVSNARQNLVEIIFANGYELQRDSYRLVKSKEKRTDKEVDSSGDFIMKHALLETTIIK